MTVAYQGVAGAFGHEACLRFLPNHSSEPRSSFAAVVAAVAAGEVEFGMLPLANSRAGEVNGVRHLIEDMALVIVEQFRLPIRLHLLGLPAAKLDQLTFVVSHRMALKQCAERLRRLNLRCREATNTALAARSLADPRTAALASAMAAQLYGLNIVLHDLQDNPDNHTLFALVRRAARILA